MAENTAAKQRRRGRGRPFEPGHSGNPRGKPPGARHKATQAAEALLDGEAEALTRKAIEKALEGDSVALRLCLDRILPPRKDRLVSFDLPDLKTAADAASVMASILKGVAAGNVAPSEAESIGKLVENFAKTLEVRSLEERIIALERKS
jgi:hypothetical protein